MLPAHLAENIRQQVLFYLQSTFDFREPAVDQAFERFLNDSDTGLFKGPWVQLRDRFVRRTRTRSYRSTLPCRFTPLNIKTVPGAGSSVKGSNSGRPLSPRARVRVRVFFVSHPRPLHTSMSTGTEGHQSHRILSDECP